MAGEPMGAKPIGGLTPEIEPIGGLISGAESIGGLTPGVEPIGGLISGVEPIGGLMPGVNAAGCLVLGAGQVLGAGLPLELDPAGSVASGCASHPNISKRQGLRRAHLLSPREQLQHRCLFNLAAAHLEAGRPREALTCLLTYQRHAGDGAGDPNLLTCEGDPDLLFNLGLAYEGLGQMSDALRCYETSARLHDPCDFGGQSDAQVKGAYCHLTLGEREAAASSFALAAQGYQRAGRGAEAAMALREAANHMIATGMGLHIGVGGALSLLRGCLQLCRDGVTEQRLTVKLQTDVGLHLCELGLLGEAERCFHEALRGCEGEGPGDSRGRAVLLLNLGAVLNAQGRHAPAMPFHIQAVLAFTSLGEKRGQAEGLANMASAQWHLGHHLTAAHFYRDALAAFTDAGDLHAQRMMRAGLTEALGAAAGEGGATGKRGRGGVASGGGGGE